MELKGITVEPNFHHINHTTMQFTHEQVLSRLVQANLIVNNKLVSRAEFKRLADIHRYGKHYKILFIGHPKENLFGFYPSVYATNPEALKEAYELFMDLVEGNLLFLGGRVLIGNCGIPLSYGKIRFIEPKN